MNQQPKTTLEGQVTDVFAHRFVVQTATGKVLADLGPKGAEAIALKQGDMVSLDGEMKPSELKVRHIVRNGGQPIVIDLKKPEHDAHAPADPASALKTAEANGFTVLGSPRRKPKHFELLGRDRAGDIVELHIELDGHLRKTKPVEDGDDKWATELRARA